MESEPITREKIDELLRFLPLFTVPGRHFIIKWDGLEKMPDGAITMPFPLYAEDVEEFFRLASQPCWNDYDYTKSNASEMLNYEEFIKNASIENVKTMLTYCVRSERFCDGFWNSVLSSGRVVVLLKRLEVLRESFS
jgi:hypothetical protein